MRARQRARVHFVPFFGRGVLRQHACTGLRAIPICARERSACSQVMGFLKNPQNPERKLFP
eukprot:1998832-Pyramimonas_sp.AAC.1